jgi:hypothetical protein
MKLTDCHLKREKTAAEIISKQPKASSADAIAQYHRLKRESRRPQNREAGTGS